MARYKAYDLNQAKMIPLTYADQVVEGSFEHALNEIVEKHLDMSAFDKRYSNDGTGRDGTGRDGTPGVRSGILLKVVLYGYYEGIISSRALAEACRRNVVFMALSADTRPHFTTLASFVSELDREIVSLFRDVLLYASELGLTGKEHFAVDGCKLPSNASKEWSGTHQEIEDRRNKLDGVAERIVERHRQRDEEEDAGKAASETKKVEKFRRKIEQIKEFLEGSKKKLGPSGNETKSNVTDRARERRKKREQAPERAKLFTREDFVYDAEAGTCACPAGHKLYQSGRNMLLNGYRVAHFKAPLTACRECEPRPKCLRHPERTVQRQLTFIKGREGERSQGGRDDGAVERMKLKLSTARGREIYGRRLGTVEPVFANLQNKGMRRFTLRGRRKVNAQWQLFTMLHNIEKIAGRARAS